MRLLTYNIEDGGGERAPLIAQVIAAAAADVVLLNEADDERVVQRLAESLSYQYVWARGSGDKHIALLTRLPIVTWHIHNRRPFTQAVLHVEMQLPNPKSRASVPSPNLQSPTSNFQSPHLSTSQSPISSLQSPISNSPTVHLFGVHLMPYFMLLPYELARWRTVRALLRLVAGEARGPHLICGDFNAAIRGEHADTHIFSAKIQRQLKFQLNRQPRFALAPITRAGYVDCYRQLHPHDAGLTWMPSALSARLDYIFADPQLAQRLSACEVVTAPPAAQASDHFPLVAEFQHD